MAVEPEQKKNTLKGCVLVCLDKKTEGIFPSKFRPLASI